MGGQSRGGREGRDRRDGVRRGVEGGDETGGASSLGLAQLGLGTDRVNPRAGRASKIMGLHLQIFYGPKIHRIEFGLDRPVKELGCRHARVDDQGSARGS